MQSKTFLNFDPTRVHSPCFVIDEQAMEANLKRLDEVQQRSGAKVLIALKAFSMFALAPLICRYLSGACASGVHEARLAREEFCQLPHNEVHTFCAAYNIEDFNEVLMYSDFVVFNSLSQWQRFQAPIAKAASHGLKAKFGLRVNPLYSESTTTLYDPCAPCSRLGIPYTQLQKADLSGVCGLHFHILSEQGFEPLSHTLDIIEKQLGEQLHQMEWLNLGGGHHINDKDYDVDGLVERIKAIQERYQLQVYLEPGEAIAVNAGVLVAQVLDITHNTMPLAVLDISATCHMPDTLGMHHRAQIFGADDATKKAHTYRLGGQTCLAGDVMGDYSFDQALDIGQRLIFDNMAHYTMVKTTTFNGINLPSIAIWNSESDDLKNVREFSYFDFKQRLS